MSPIHDQSYRRFAGTRGVPGTGWVVIASHGIRSLVARKGFLVVLLFAWAQFVVRAVMLYLSANFPQMDIIAPSSEMFRDFFEQQGFFVFVVTVSAGSGLIANDRRAHALQIYLSKPLSRAEYVAGKLAVLLTFLLGVTWLPAMLLLALQVLFAGDLVFLRQHLFLVPAITLFALLYALLASFTMLALSSLSTSARYVAILYAGALLFTEAVFATLGAIMGGTGLAWVSFSANLAQVGDVIFRMAPRYDTPWLVSAGVVLALIGASMVVLERRVRGVEVIT